MKRVLVTGAGGFVGRWIQAMWPIATRSRDLELVCSPPGFNLLDREQVEKVLGSTRPDVIVHLAAQSNVPRSFRDPEGTLSTNVVGTLRLFEGLRQAKMAPRVVYVSSGDVYGLVPDTELPIEERRPLRPCNPYAVSKVAAEALCHQWARTNNLDVVIARPFNHIGAGQSEDFAVPAFARQICEIKSGRRAPVIEVGNIDVWRDFTHVADVVDCYVTLLDHGQTGEIYNVASGESRSLKEVLSRLQDLAGIRAEVRTDPKRYRPAEQPVVRVSNMKVTRLGWRPTRSVDDALKDILKEWEEKLANG